MIWLLCLSANTPLSKAKQTPKQLLVHTTNIYSSKKERMGDKMQIRTSLMRRDCQLTR